MKRFKNIEMEVMLERLKLLLDYRDKIGYVAARNTRLLKEALSEFLIFKYNLIEKYGEKITDENGETKVSIHISSPNFKDFEVEFLKIAEIEHDIDLMTLKYDEVIGTLSGEEILKFDWMLEE